MCVCVYVCATAAAAQAAVVKRTAAVQAGGLAALSLHGPLISQHGSSRSQESRVLDGVQHSETHTHHPAVPRWPEGGGSECISK